MGKNRALFLPQKGSGRLAKRYMARVMYISSGPVFWEGETEDEAKKQRQSI
jgi:hypothetical protein